MTDNDVPATGDLPGEETQTFRALHPGGPPTVPTRTYSPYDRIRAAEEAALRAHEAAHPWTTPFDLDLDDDEDRTIYAQRRRALWVLQVVGGSTYPLEDVTTFGRGALRPIPGVLGIEDETRTMSRLHGELRRYGETWHIKDLGSTNGTFVRAEDGDEITVPVGAAIPVTGMLRFGDLEAEIAHEAAQE
jgi:hypothetical protein